MKQIGTIAIVGGGKVSKQFLSEIVKSDYIVGVDRGAYWLLANGSTPDIAIGDFDSVISRELRIIKQNVKRVEEHPKEKDATDMELAVEHAIKLNPKRVVIYGALGNRLDHTIGNIHLLERLSDMGIEGVIRDRYNEVRLLTKTFIIDRRQHRNYKYLSVLPVSDEMEVTLTGFRYDVSRALIRRGQTLGISNEIKGVQATIDVHRGRALVIRSRD